MSEKKNIVIKVKYPTPGNSGQTDHSPSGKVTEWNFKRIGLTLGSLLVAILALFYVTSSDDIQPPETVAVPTAQPILPEQHQPVETKPDSPTIQSQPVNEKPRTPTDAQVVRALLTNKVEKNEPGHNIALPLKISRKETIGVYYFVELKGMKGKTVYHEWVLNDTPVSRKKVNISADPWRTSSKQVIAYTMNNDWKARLVDESGKVLVEKAFNLELK